MAYECMKAELDLFKEAPIQTIVDHGQWIEYCPLTVLNQGQVIEVTIDGAGDENLDLYNTYCYMACKICKLMVPVYLKIQLWPL